MSNTKQRVLDEIKRDLFSSDDAVVMHALHLCREEGNATLVEPLLALYAQSESPRVRTEVADMLNTLKVSGTESAFIAALMRRDWKAMHGEIVSFMWNSGLQPVEHMHIITQVALDGSFQDAFECLTLLESMEEIIPEEIVLECVSMVNEYVNQHPKSDKLPLLKQYMALLQQHDGAEDF
jgi:hypothetical protein